MDIAPFVRIKFKIAFIAIPIYCFLCSCSTKSNNTALADQLVTGHLTSNLDSALIKKTCDTLLQNTIWVKKVQVNKPYDGRMINIYVIEGHAGYIKGDRHFSPLANNCYFAGNGIIFLDIDYLRSFLAKHQVNADIPNVYLLPEQECLLYWAIGHEIGHLVAGHPSGHMEADALDRFAATSSLDNQYELQADSFFVSTLKARPRLRSSEESLMIDILNAEIKQKVGLVKTAGVGILYNYSNSEIITYARQPTHPEYVIRLARMLELSAKTSDDNGLCILISGFVKHLRESSVN